MSKQNLKNIAKTIAGYTFRKALQENTDGGMFVIRAKDISDELYIDKGNLIRIDFQEHKTKAFVKKNDIIISVRGKFKAGIIRDSIKNIIASSSVYILRLEDKKILPEYLTIYFNSRAGQSELKKIATGTIIKTILRKELEDIKITIPKLHTQNKIIELYKNNKAQQKILDRKKVLIDEVLENIINKI